MNTVSLNNLWSYLQGLSLTKSNRQWLANHLIEATDIKKEKSIMTDSEIKKGLKDAFVQLNEVKEGKRKTKNVKELLNEL